VTWATSVPILVFLGLSVLDLVLMYATDRQTNRRRQTASLLNAPPKGWGIITYDLVQASLAECTAAATVTLVKSSSY